MQINPDHVYYSLEHIDQWVIEASDGQWYAVANAKDAWTNRVNIPKPAQLEAVTIPAARAATLNFIMTGPAGRKHGWRKLNANPHRVYTNVDDTTHADLLAWANAAGVKLPDLLRGILATALSERDAQ